MSTTGARVGQGNKIVAAFTGTEDSAFAAGHTGFNTGVNGLNAWLSPTTSPFTADGDVRSYVISQTTGPTRGTANSGLTFSPDSTPTRVGPRKTSTGPQIVLVFNPRSL
jgi:hypothetical protein